jgi:hypothetical protein
MERTTVYEDRPLGMGRMDFMNRISWSAVFAGVLVAIVTQMLLSLLGLGVGLSTINPVTEQNPTEGLGIGSAIWYIISSLLSLFLGGWVAGRLASAPRLFDGVIHGILTWSLVTLLTIYFLTTAVGNVIGGTGQLLGGLLKTAGSAAASAGPGLGNMVQGQLKANGIDMNDLDLNDLKAEANKVLRQTGDPALSPGALERKADRAVNQAGNTAEKAASNPQAADDMAGSLFSGLFKQGQSTVAQVDRDDAVNVVMKRTGKSRPEAEKTVDNWISTYKQAAVKFEQTKKEAEIQARHIADDAAGAVAKAALFGFFGLLLGSVAAGYGAKMGTDSKDDYNKLDRPVREVR